MPWASKKETNIYSKAFDGPVGSNYSLDFVNGHVNAKRNPIRPERAQWSDRPKFSGLSQYRVSFYIFNQNSHVFRNCPRFIFSHRRHLKGNKQKGGKIINPF